MVLVVLEFQLYALSHTYVDWSLGSRYCFWCVVVFKNMSTGFLRILALLDNLLGISLCDASLLGSCSAEDCTGHFDSAPGSSVLYLTMA